MTRRALAMAIRDYKGQRPIYRLAWDAKGVSFDGSLLLSPVTSP